MPVQIGKVGKWLTMGKIKLSITKPGVFGGYNRYNRYNRNILPGIVRRFGAINVIVLAVCVAKMYV